MRSWLILVCLVVSCGNSWPSLAADATGALDGATVVDWKKWEALATIATPIIALLAALGTILASAKTAGDLKAFSLALQKVEKSFTAQSVPVLKFYQFQWVKSSHAPMTKDNPPTGIKVDLKNYSSTPVIVHRTDLVVTMGVKVLDDFVERIEPADSIIIPPNSLHECVVKQGSVFKNYITNKTSDPMAPPFLNFKIEIEYSNVVSPERFRYEGSYSVAYTPADDFRFLHVLAQSDKLSPVAVAQSASVK